MSNGKAKSNEKPLRPKDYVKMLQKAKGKHGDDTTWDDIRSAVLDFHAFLEMMVDNIIESLFCRFEFKYRHADEVRYFIQSCLLSKNTYS